jgi:hypothetical protein
MLNQCPSSGQRIQMNWSEEKRDLKRGGERGMGKSIRSVVCRGSGCSWGTFVADTGNVQEFRRWNLKWLARGCALPLNTGGVNGLWSTPRLSHQTGRPFWENGPRGMAMVNARCSVICPSESSATSLPLRPPFHYCTLPWTCLDLR